MKANLQPVMIVCCNFDDAIAHKLLGESYAHHKGKSLWEATGTACTVKYRRPKLYEFLLGPNAKWRDSLSTSWLNNIGMPNVATPHKPAFTDESNRGRKEGVPMLVVSRKVGERIMIGSNITLTILEIRGGSIKLGCEAPADVPILREEVARKQRNGVDARGKLGAALRCGPAVIGSAISSSSFG
ncbi:MAG TPA: carbon storage regulator [Pirellulales bacterium]